MKAPRISEDVTRPSQPLCSRRRFYRVERRDISFLRFILEAYEGAATLTTVRPAGGLVMVTSAPGQDDLVSAVLSALDTCGDVRLEPLAAPPSAAQGAI